MRKALFLALTVVVACGAGPFRGGILGRVAPAPAPSAQPAAQAQPAAAVAVRPAKPAENAQVAFKGPQGLTINWDTIAIGSFDSAPLTIDAAKNAQNKQNFQTAKAYRLKLSNIPDYPDTVLYPTLTINAVSPRTKAYLDHNALPIEFSAQDIENVLSGNFVTKVVFLPSQQYQNLALAGGTSTVVSTQLPPGANPIVEAQNRGAVLAVIQIGNKDLSLDGSLSADADVTAAITASQQFPISGVNAPAFGTPASESASHTAELPTVPLPKEQPVLQQLDPVPSSGIPETIDSTWNDSRL